MKVYMLALAAVAVSLVAAPARADEKLAQAKGCLACHKVDAKVVGPSYKEVAARAAKDKTNADALAKTILAGSTNKYGPVPMPANKIDAKDAKTLAEWILKQK